MQRASMQPAGDPLDAERVEYFRAVADYAEMVGRGADLGFLIEGSDYVLEFDWRRRCPPSLARRQS